MIKKTLIALISAIGMLSLVSCQDWGQMDPPPGVDIYPTRAKVATYDFNESENIDELEYITSVSKGAVCEVVMDDSLNSRVLHAGEGALVSVFNALSVVKLQNGAGFTFWLRVPEKADLKPMLKAGGTEIPLPLSELMADGRWHFVAIQVKKDGYDYYCDGTLVTTVGADNTALIDPINVGEIVLGNTNGEYWIDDFSFIRNQMTLKDAARPTITPAKVKLPDPVYFNDFNSGAGDCKVMGGGSFRSDDAPGFNKVFQNVTGGRRENYLLLPEHVLSHSAESQKMTIGVWVNSVNAGASGDYMWAPLFMAYTKAPENGTNTLPMFACQYRGVLQVNNDGWTDYTDAQNGANKLYHGDTDWLADKGWHYYTAVLDGENAKVYLDGVLVNEWNMDGANNTQMGLFRKGADLKYVCLGGNQAWDWADNDPGFAFDDIAIYNDALSTAQIKKIIDDKPTSGGGISLPTPVFFSDFSSTTGLKIVGGGSFTTDPDKHFGAVFQNITGGMRQNYLLLPEDALSHSAETNQMSIGVWVNAANAGASGDYMWAPLFMAYGAAPNNGTNTFPMFACQYRGVLQVNNDGWTDYTDAQNVNGANKLYHGDTDWLADKGWHYYTAVFDGENAKVYLDGVLANEWKMDGSNNTQMGLFRKGADLKYICLGGNQAWDWADNDPGFAFDDIAIYDMALSETDIQNIITVKHGGGAAGPQAYYRNTFDDMNGAQIIGAGSIANDPAHGAIFQNVAGAKSTNYLLLPQDVLAHSAESKELSIAFWVNAANAGAFGDYTYSPFFTAYANAPSGDNGAPMMALQSRGGVQVNCNGWCDFTGANHVDGKVNIYNKNAWEAGDAAYNFVNNWLDDKAWHLYVVTFTENEVIQYMDGEIKNHWKIDNKTEGQIVGGLFSNGGDLKYVCLGGNQAWNWGDPDAGFAFDDVQFFDFALSASDIEALMGQY